MADIDTVKQAHELLLMQVEGVEGVGIGVDDIGDPAIVVYVNGAGVQKLLPQQIDGFRLKVENLKGPILCCLPIAEAAAGPHASRCERRT